ncbi:hypothetical protein [Parasulfitobacter algicola]|uniref:Uncharacterized protein n=1 Tax=Parasulfitobacter algicola TaxID=2614809 RepID=A0ABX2IMQ1_9RHOB|nr:hypothetical protein [Sulfitobacter algicola]NSX54154.1 hypothetical protein [Sulfitobacter algicola]
MFGVSLPLSTWFILIGGALLALIIPFSIIGSFTSFLPEPFDLIASNLLAGIGFPVLLCYLHSRKMFGRGLGSVFFRIYTWFYLVLGLFSISMGFLSNEAPNLAGIMFGVIMLATGLGMLWWSRRTAIKLQAAYADEAEQRAAAEREEQIQIQAEAIARAEAMKEH